MTDDDHWNQHPVFNADGTTRRRRRDGFNPAMKPKRDDRALEGIGQIQATDRDLTAQERFRAAAAHIKVLSKTEAAVGVNETVVTLNPHTGELWCTDPDCGDGCWHTVAVRDRALKHNRR